MYTCLCGNAVDTEGASCERCSALHILGLDAKASQKEIESTYRVLVKVWHPDRFQNDQKLRDAADEKLRSINAAYTYLSSVAPPRTRKRAAKKPEAPATSLQTKGSARRSFLDPSLVTSMLLRCVILLVGLAVPVLMMVGLDGWLSSNPATSGFYAQYRAQVLFALRTNVTAAKQSIARTLHLPEPAPTAPVEVPPAASASTADQAPIHVPVPHVPMPYVTVGLTQDEVISVMGPPATATSSTLRYRNAVFFFAHGVVNGWTVDPALIPLHVKLWPSGHPDPRITTFAVGSSKNDVIAVQGTPTTLAENKLVYGSSEVFLDAGRVIGWNDNHASERLRVAPH